MSADTKLRIGNGPIIPPTDDGPIFAIGEDGPISAKGVALDPNAPPFIVEDESPIVAECLPNCAECAAEREHAEAVDVAEVRSLAIDAIDWRATAVSVGIHPSDFRKFLEGHVTLTQPERNRVRARLAEPVASLDLAPYEIPATTRPAVPEASAMATHAVPVVPVPTPRYEPASARETASDVPRPPASLQSDAPPCSTCGDIMVRNGSCYRCFGCGSTSGCS